MTPFMPPPPCWTARRFHSAGNHMRKLIGRAGAAASIGAIRPSTSHRAGRESAAGTHFGSASVMFETGSPMAPEGIASPNFAGVQSVAAIERGGAANRAIPGCAAG